MFEGYHQVNFLEALNAWDESNKDVICELDGKIYEFNIGDFRHDFKVNGSMILEGNWFVEN